MCDMPDTLHKNQEGTYTIAFFDLFGRHVKGKDVLKESLSESTNTGNEGVKNDDNLDSFIIKRTVYNSKQHMHAASLRF